MFCKNPQYSAKLIDLSFIAGIKSENIKSYIETKDSNYLNAECLLTFPNVSDMVNPGVLDVIKIRKIITLFLTFLLVCVSNRSEAFLFRRDTEILFDCAYK